MVFPTEGYRGQRPSGERSAGNDQGATQIQRLPRARRWKGAEGEWIVKLVIITACFLTFTLLNITDRLQSGLMRLCEVSLGHLCIGNNG